MNTYIHLNGLRMYARHGVAEQETFVGNEYTLDVRLKADLRRAMETDDVADTVSYADVYEALRAEMAVPAKLLEHVAGRMVRRLFRDFPQIEEVRLTLAKRTPPMGADLESAAVEIEAVRGAY